MAIETIPVIQDEDKEAIEFTYKNANDGTDIDISGSETTKIEFRVFSQDYQTLLITATLVNAKIVKTGGAGSNTCEYRPGPLDYSDVGLYRTEMYTEFSDGREDRNQDLMLNIKQKAPTS